MFIILRGSPEDDESECWNDAVDDAVDMSTTLAFKLEGEGGDSGDVDWRDEELIVVDELFTEAAEGLGGG